MGLIDFLFLVFELVIIARVIISWIPVDPYNQVVRFIHDVTEPILAPVRRLLQRQMPNVPYDLSPMVVLVLAWVLQTIIHQTFR